MSAQHEVFPSLLSLSTASSSSSASCCLFCVARCTLLLLWLLLLFMLQSPVLQLAFLCCFFRFHNLLLPVAVLNPFPRCKLHCHCRPPKMSLDQLLFNCCCLPRPITNVKHTWLLLLSYSVEQVAKGLLDYLQVTQLIPEILG